jgi:hypothetical protein
MAIKVFELYLLKKLKNTRLDDYFKNKASLNRLKLYLKQKHLPSKAKAKEVESVRVANARIAPVS